MALHLIGNFFSFLLIAFLNFSIFVVSDDVRKKINTAWVMVVYSILQQFIEFPVIMDKLLRPSHSDLDSNSPTVAKEWKSIFTNLSSIVVTKLLTKSEL